MAKISARGAHEVARFLHPDGRQLLVRSDGVILSKSSVPGSGWTVFLGFTSPEAAIRNIEQALDRKYRRVRFE